MTAPPRSTPRAPLEPPRRPLSPWQLLYGAVHRARRAWYRNRARRLPVPVVSIGNLHWGGTGKTPLTAAVAAHLRDRGHRVCILSRGYGGRGDGVRVVSDGGPPLLGPEVAGDEPVLLAEELPGVAVVVGPERWAAGCHALARLSPVPDLLVLDDGFSHLALARDLDLLAFPASDPFAGGRLLPTGRLREPLASVERADAVLLTGLPPAAAPAPAAEPPEGGADGSRADSGGADRGPSPAGPPSGTRPPGEALSSGETHSPGETSSSGETLSSGEMLAAALRPHGFAGPGFACALAAGTPRPVAGEPGPGEEAGRPSRDGGPQGAAGADRPAPGTRVLLVSAIARPERFAASAEAACRQAGLEIAGHLPFRDHHPYPPASLERIRRAAAEAGAAWVLATAKDRVKLAGRLDLPLAELPVRAEPEAAFWSWLDGRLEALGAGRREEPR